MFNDEQIDDQTTLLEEYAEKTGSPIQGCDAHFCISVILLHGSFYESGSVYLMDNENDTYSICRLELDDDDEPIEIKELADVSTIEDVQDFLKLALYTEVQ